MSPINFGNFKTTHAYAVLLSFASGVGLAVIGYLQAQPASTILQALSSLASFKTLAMGVAMVAVTTLVHLVQGSVVAPPAPPSVGSKGLDFRSAEVPPAPAPRNVRAQLLPVAPLFALLGMCIAMIVILAACLSASDLSKLKTATDAAGNVCQVILTAVDPALPPLCTTADVVANAIESILASSSPTDSGVSEAGVAIGAASGVSRAAVYDWVAAHGGTKLALP